MARRRERLRSARDPCREPARGRAPALRLAHAAAVAARRDGGVVAITRAAAAAAANDEAIVCEERDRAAAESAGVAPYAVAVVVAVALVSHAPR